MRDALTPKMPFYFRQIAKALFKLSRQKHLYAIRQGLLLTMPVMVIGSFASLLINLPLPAYQKLMAGLCGPHWQNFGAAVCSATAGIISLLLIPGIGYFLTTARTKHGEAIHPVLTAITALSCAIVMLLWHADAQAGAVLPFNWLGVNGIFPAILTALLSSELFLFISRRRPMRLNSFFDSADPVFSQALAAILPFGATLGVFTLLKMALITSGISDPHQFLYDVLQSLFRGQSATLGTAVNYHLLVQALWFFGMHGQNVLISVQNL